MIDPVYARIGAVLRRRRDEVGMTQATLATRLGLSRTSVTNVERGRQPLAVHQLILASQALSLDPGHLLNEVVAAGPDVEPAVPDAFRDLVAKLHPARGRGR